MLAAFDASGHESDQPYLVVAGFISSAGDWDDFSRAWLQRLERDDLPCFHAAEFATCSGIFEKWAGPEKAECRHRLSSDLMELIVRHAYRYFVQGVRPEDFRRSFTEDERKAFDINAYALCGRTCVADVGRWIRGDSLQWERRQVPDLVFEDGDIGKGKLRDMLVRHNYPEPQFLPGKTPQETKLGLVQPYVPLQASDWLAYESFRLLKQGTPDRDQWRWAMRQFFDRMQGRLGFWTLPDMDQVKDDLEALDSGVAAPIVIADPFAGERGF
jgi:hypothetical protein